MRVLAAAFCLAAGTASANDGFGGLSATGLTFGRTDAVAMETEDLTIGFDRIHVAYQFRNLTAQDVTGEVIFPLPPIAISHLMMSDFNLPEDLGRENLVDFTARVDGRPVAVNIDRIAVIEPEWDESRPLSAQYDTPGREVTAVLARHGIPLTLDPFEAIDAILVLSQAAQAELVAEGAVEFFTPEEGEAEVWPLWSVVLRYHWTQTFPAGAVVRVEHDYESRPTGGLFYWSHPPDDWLVDTVARYCIDEATSAAIMARLTPAEEDSGQVWGVSWNIAYVLRTANSWAGPIGRFRLTVDKGAETRIVSLCAEGLRRTGPTTFVMEKTGFVPERDLEIIIVAPLE